MKIALLAVFAIVTFTGCTKTTVNQVNQAYSAIYTISANQWAAGQDPDGTKFFYATLPITELTQQIDQNGGVNVYLSFDNSTVADPTYEALPEVFNGIAYGTFHTTGLITIDLRAADGGDLSSPITSDTQVKVVLVDAQPLD
jgi:hypothetical protein